MARSDDRIGIAAVGGDWSFHALWLRHAFVSLGLQAGVDIVSISKMLGHKSFACTAQVYTHVLDATPQAAFDMLDLLVGAE